MYEMLQILGSMEVVSLLIPDQHLPVEKSQLYEMLRILTIFVTFRFSTLTSEKSQMYEMCSIFVGLWVVNH